MGMTRLESSPSTVEGTEVTRFGAFGIVSREIVACALLTGLFVATGAIGYLLQTTGVSSSVSLIRMGVPELARGSDLIVAGTVRSQVSRPTATGVLTESVLEIRETFKGTPAGLVTVTTRGGRLANVIETASDEATLVQGDAVIAFIVRLPSGGYQILGGFQGRYRVVGDTAANERNAIPLTELVRAIQMSAAP